MYKEKKKFIKGGDGEKGAKIEGFFFKKGDFLREEKIEEHLFSSCRKQFPMISSQQEPHFIPYCYTVSKRPDLLQLSIVLTELCFSLSFKMDIK